MALRTLLGWSQIRPSPDSRLVYVSSSTGSDDNDGRSEATPRRTIAKGVELLRDLKPDWLCCKANDVWSEPLGHWKKSGRSIFEPMVVTSYGAGERPLLRTGDIGALWTNGGGGSPPVLNHLAFVGLAFQADNGNATGIELVLPCEDVLFEDMRVAGYGNNVAITRDMPQGRHTDVSFRRSVIVDAHSHDPEVHSQGLYAYAVDGLLIEECVLDHNGWSESAAPTIYNHNLYLDNGNTDVVVKGCVISQASSHGLQMRSGGWVWGNLFLRNSIACSVGGGDKPTPGGVSCDVTGNVILEGKDIDAANPRGWGLWFGNIKAGTVRHNVIAHNTLGTQPAPFTLDGSSGIGVHGLVSEDNVVWKWAGALVPGLVRAPVQELGQVDQFIKAARKQSRATWQPRYTAATATRLVLASVGTG